MEAPAIDITSGRYAPGSGSGTIELFEKVTGHSIERAFSPDSRVANPTIFPGYGGAP
jgi:hypothetical protein